MIIGKIFFYLELAFSLIEKKNAKKISRMMFCTHNFNFPDASYYVFFSEAEKS